MCDKEIRQDIRKKIVDLQRFDSSLGAVFRFLKMPSAQASMYHRIIKTMGMSQCSGGRGGFPVPAMNNHLR